MIGYLKGSIITVSQGRIIINCNGVGYQVEVGTQKNTFLIDDEVELFIYTNVRENEISLFGFEKEEELRIFELLIGVNGVGPKAGISIVAELGVSQVVRSIVSNNTDDLEKVKGIGRKTSRKIILDLADKIKDYGFGIDAVSKKDKKVSDGTEEKLEEVEVALSNLGYQSRDIASAINKIRDHKDLDTMEVEEMIKYVLGKI